MFFYLALTLIVFHFLGDWMLQSRAMADNKSKFTGLGWLAWGSHVAVYTFVMYMGALFFVLTSHIPVAITVPATWALLNGALHGIQDKITSQFTSKFYKQQRYHGFFTIIGFDGMLHYLTMFISAKIMFNL